MEFRSIRRDRVWEKVRIFFFKFLHVLKYNFHRKYYRGKLLRKPGIQWGLTGFKIYPNIGKTLAVGLELLPYNYRDVSTILPGIVQQMKEGGTVITDYWKAYPQSFQVNLSKHFVDPVTKVHTNNFEGMLIFIFSFKE